MTADELLELLTAHYLGGHDFNGYPVRDLPGTRDELGTLLSSLVEQELISINFGTYHPNPYVKAMPPEPVPDQLEKLDGSEDWTHLTLYPETRHLEAVVSRDDYVGRPFTLRMALGAPELIPAAFFDLSVLEAYRNDPRYYYDNYDFSGRISVSDEYYMSEHMQESDQILLESFGFGFNDDRQRAVCVFPVYLSRLTPEHQQIWAAKELGSGYKMHPAYYASSIMGDFPEKVSIFQAFTEELHQLQQMCEWIGEPPMVRSSFNDEKPANFTFLIRPTLKELQDFHLLLDQMMSDNLNQKFFASEGIDPEREVERSGGRVEVHRKGTIVQLEEWLSRIDFPDPAPKDNMLVTFRKVRKLRQKPAHSPNDNRFDLAYYNEQRELVIEAYTAVRTLRLILANHPGLRDFDGIPDWLAQGAIYSY